MLTTRNLRVVKHNQGYWAMIDNTGKIIMSSSGNTPTHRAYLLGLLKRFKDCEVARLKRLAIRYFCLTEHQWSRATLECRMRWTKNAEEREAKERRELEAEARRMSRLTDRQWSEAEIDCKGYWLTLAAKRKIRTPVVR